MGSHTRRCSLDVAALVALACLEGAVGRWDATDSLSSPAAARPTSGTAIAILFVLAALAVIAVVALNNAGFGAM